MTNRSDMRLIITIMLFLLALSSCVTAKNENVQIRRPGYSLTFPDGRYRIYTDTRVAADEHGQFQLMKGAIAAEKPLTKNLKVKTELLGNAQWGGCNMLLLTVNCTIPLKCRVWFDYKFAKGNWKFDRKGHIVAQKRDRLVYGVFIPHSTYNETHSVDITMELSSEKYVIIRYKDTIPISPTEWDSQTVTFGDAKSEELNTPSGRNIAAERRKRQRIWNENSNHRYFLSGMRYPVDDTRDLTSEFGYRRNWVYTKGRSSTDVHTGVDYANKTGTPIIASCAGQVRYSEYAAYLGNAVFIDHGMGLFSIYMHNSNLIAKEGDIVDKGDIIAEMGMTGAATGPHCHWETRIYGMPVDPRSLFFLNDLKF
ncbi:MAG: M23 family metallopeptidase [Spirochaetales bacterium]|nr:M23 family metallopeptidase [Spirochaetales bacterium]